MRTLRPNRGFTLIELLVVMAIIATLAGLGVVGIPAYLRNADKLKCQDHLRQIGGMLRIYESENKGLPRADGAAFVLAIWGRQLDKNEKTAEVFFCPSTKRFKDFQGKIDLEPDDIDFTGPDFTAIMATRRNGLSTSEPNAAVKAISGNKVPRSDEYQSTDDLKKDLPHAGKGVCILYLDGSVDWVEAAQFQDDIPVYGPESPKESLRMLKPGFKEHSASARRRRSRRRLRQRVPPIVAHSASIGSWNAGA
jgi:prepilin-type N-terminal cleavage/methylation domain-containing protein